MALGVWGSPRWWVVGKVCWERRELYGRGLKRKDNFDGFLWIGCFVFVRLVVLEWWLKNMG